MWLSSWAELACGEIFQGAKACVEFGGRQAPLAVERAQKIGAGRSPLRVLHSIQQENQVAVGIAAGAPDVDFTSGAAFSAGRMRNPFNPQYLISHLTNSNGLR